MSDSTLSTTPISNLNLEYRAPEFDGIRVRGAREHNLKGVDVDIPRDKITVITGLSGSGKSSLAFDTIYAEGQRRYVESLSSYARQFMHQLKKPEMESISGLSPSIAIDQKSIGSNPRSTVGTVTEVYDFLRLLFSKVGIPRCPNHDIPVEGRTPKEIVDEILGRKAGEKFLVLAPVARNKKGEFLAEFQRWEKKGFVRARVDGEWIELANAKRLSKYKKHNIDLLVDQLKVDEKYQKRLSESVNTALSLAENQVAIEWMKSSDYEVFSLNHACPQCGYSFPEMDPRLFSFNDPRGACETCNGLGTVEEYFDEENEDGVEEEYYIEAECEACSGDRLRPEALNVFVGDKNIAELSHYPSEELLEFLKKLKFKARHQLIAEKIMKQILFRVEYMVEVGTGYLSLDRRSRTLSGGEAQRIRLATQVGSALVGVLYVLDEPSIGLHPRDHHRLLEILRRIRDRGNTILMVEHDEDTMMAADYLIDIGPGAGVHGGHIIARGAPSEVKANKDSLTAKYLRREEMIPVPSVRREGNGHHLTLKGATGNNLKNVTMSFPLGTLTGVTGVSGSGKSTLIRDTLYRHLAAEIYQSSAEPEPFKSIDGVEHIDKVIEIDQRPIGRTPRSTPATYTGLFPLIRSLYSALPESKMRGFKPGHFSFNVKGGRCEDCQGHGAIKMEMNFLADVYVTCETCQGMRYNHEVLNIKFKEKSIGDVLQMSVAEALPFFEHHRQIHKKLKTLEEVGLDYITLGQASTTLSGGEAQRVKLSKELSKRATGNTIYILDEPTTGLHFEDVRKLVELLQTLVSQGNTVLVIEHHLDVIKNCDHVIDLGPEGGRLGGEIVVSGTPEDVAKCKASETGKFLKALL